MKIIKPYFLVLITLILIFSVKPITAYSVGDLSINVPATVETEVNEEFRITVTISNNTADEVYIANVWGVITSANIFLESQAVNRMIRPGSTSIVHLLGRTHSAGFHRVIIEVEALGHPLISQEVLVEATQPAGAEPTAKLEVTSVSFNPEAPDLDSNFDISFHVQNTGNADARDVELTFDGGVNFSVTTLTNRVRIPHIARGQTLTATFTVAARDTRTSSDVTLSIAHGGGQPQQEKLNLPLPEKPKKPQKAPPKVIIESFDLDKTPESNLILNLTIKNTGELSARNVAVNFNGGDKLFTLDGTTVRRIPSLDASSTRIVQFVFQPRGVLSNHPVEITFDYTDPDGKELTESEKIFITTDLEPSLKISSFSVSPQVREGNFMLNLVIQNKGVTAAKDVALRLTGTEAFPIETSNLVFLPDLSADSSENISILLRSSDLTRKTISLPIEISYKSTGGAEHSANETIIISAEAAGITVEEDDEEIRGTPRVMLVRHTLSEERLFAGSTFTLSLYIRNNSDRRVGNMKISLGSIQVGGTGGTAGGTVFSPLDGSSSSFFVEDIAARDQLIKEVTLLVDPSAAAMTYSLPINIEFEDDDGKAFTVNESVNIPVLQESRLQILSTEIPEFAMAGQAVPVSLEFANTGRVALSNVFVAIEGDFGKENATYFVPRLDMGISDFFQGMIIPQAEGILTGQIIITFLDAINEEVRIEHPFEMTISPMVDLPLDMPIEPIPPDAGLALPWTTAVPIGIGLLIAIVIVILFIKKRKAKRRNDFLEERL